MIVHWSSQKSTAISGIAYDKVFKCGFPECQNLSESVFETLGTINVLMAHHLQHENRQDDYPFAQPAQLPLLGMQH
jgi:hypothetical protein